MFSECPGLLKNKGFHSGVGVSGNKSRSGGKDCSSAGKLQPSTWDRVALGAQLPGAVIQQRAHRRGWQRQKEWVGSLLIVFVPGECSGLARSVLD